MDNCKENEQKPLLNELTRGKDLVNQLRFHLSSTSTTGEFLIDQVLSCFDRALLMLTWKASDAELQVTTRPTFGIIDSPQQSGSPRSDDSENRDAYKKRYT